jgi:hypothetical protein
MLTARGDQALVHQGTMSTSNRRTIVDRLDTAEAGDGLLVIGTAPFIGEGFNTLFSRRARSPTTAYSSSAPAA